MFGAIWDTSLSEGETGAIERQGLAVVSVVERELGLRGNFAL